MKFRSHETFFIRKGWLSKGMKYVKNYDDVFVSKDPKPMDRLGLGSNMVKSLRYWMQATGLTEEPKSGKRTQKFTDVGDIIFHNDRYLEEQGTLALIQWQLARNKDLATSWFYFFYIFKMQEFTREDFVQGLKNYVLMENAGEAAADRSYQDDFNCIINTYLSRYKTSTRYTSPENNISCPLGELGLVDVANRERKLYKKTMLSSSLLPAWIALAIILLAHKDKKEIPISDLLNGEGSIGRAFNLDMTSLLDILRRMENRETIRIVRTAGLDVVRILTDKTALECIGQYYQEIIAE
ncbi:DUF4007 family protein [Anaerovibrio sp.]|uniref:DUF4007 family protein n=1 Tax=Anaerovibrio sp. TaxID=1872532 RepID=UPI0025BB3BB3|nr:DUF4007 family protein [Anaerovibrio sp.]MBR2142527.1 DUF4007 family protein [Anaerovibrio sp.]